MIALIIIVSAMQLILLFALLNQYFLLLLSVIKKPQQSKSNEESPQRHFALLIPAHNEELVIGATVRTALSVSYPVDKFDVIVIADHCEDNTAQYAQKAGAICFERNSGAKGRKGYALAWGFEKILDKKYDACIVLDADSRVDQDFLTEFDRGLKQGHLALQGQHIISNPKGSIFNSLASIDMRLNNRLRNLARHNIGYSARLMGDVMCLKREILLEYPWRADSLVEDIEYGLQLLVAGVHIAYVQSAKSYGQAAGSWRSAGYQRLRWHGGVADVKKRWRKALLIQAVLQRRLELVDRWVELTLPSFTTLTALTLAVIAIQAALANWTTFLLPVWMMMMMLAAWAAYPFLGLLLDGAPLRLLGALSVGPFYVMWRVWITLRSRFASSRGQWIRTARTEELGR